MVKSTSSVPYCFVSGQTDKSQAATSSKYMLVIRQQPQRAKVCGLKERDRRPIDPPPIVQIKLTDPRSDRNKDYLQSPYLFMCCNLVHANDSSGEIVAPAHRALAGTVVSSLNRLKDVDNSDGGFFVFGDMSARIDGRFCLRFTLFELIEGQVVHVMTSTSDPFTVYTSKTFPGMSESTFLSRSFSDQGVRIRIRKDHHVKPKKPLHSDAVDGSAMHSPPSSCHEADHSDNDADMHPPVKRSRPSPRLHQDAVHDAPAYSSSRHVPIVARTQAGSGIWHSPPESMDRTPPSSPHSSHTLDYAPQRPHNVKYVAEDAQRHYDGYSSARPHHGHVSEQRPYYESHAHHNPEYSTSGPGSGPYPRPHANSSSSYSSSSLREQHAYVADSHRSFANNNHPSHEHSHFSSAYSSSGYAPSYPMGAAHSSLPSRPHHVQNCSSAPLPAPPMNAGRHGFPASLLNDQDMDYVPAAPAESSFHSSYGSRGHSHRGVYHSRTPSISSQHSDGNFTPPHPLSPADSHHGQLPGCIALSPRISLPSILPSLSRAMANEKIQLPPIHTLSTFSPTMSSHGRTLADHSIFVRP